MQKIASSLSGEGFDLCRVTRSKPTVGLCPNTIRAYEPLGLQIHRIGKVAFFSKSQLAALIVSGALGRAKAKRAQTGGAQ